MTHSFRVVTPLSSKSGLFFRLGFKSSDAKSKIEDRSISVPPKSPIQSIVCEVNKGARMVVSTLPSRILSSRAASSLLNVARRRGIMMHEHPPCQMSSLMYRSISTTHTSFAQITVNVPSMGDSITEGTIVEWCIPPGSRVREGDVLCLVETDKVTVDIKADRDGVLVRQLGEVEGVVEVGTGLYVLDTDASTATIPDVAMVDASLDAADEPPAVTAAVNKTTLSRKKSIQFLGKEGWKARRLGSSAAPAAPSATSTIPTSGKKNGPTSITVIPYSPMLGRPTITDEEMMALMLGGADEAPLVIKGKGVGEVTFVGGKVVTAGPRGIWAV